MKIQPLISIVIPIYNSEKFLNNCINSILAQTYTNIEIVLVNDGSIDSSGEIINQYKMIDNRCKVIHLKNGGVSTARNIGIYNCSGDYICFIDSDDTIEPNYIEDFVTSIETEIEIYIQGTKIIKNDGQIDIIQYNKVGINDIKEIFEINNLCSHGYAACKMYRTQLIKENNIRFNKEVKFSEDLLFILECLLYTDRIKYINKTGYNYFLRNGNASSKEFPLENESIGWKLFYSLIKNISIKYSIELINNNNVGEIYNMLLSRIRNTLYNGKYNKDMRVSFFKTMNKEELYYMYKYSYKSNNIVKIGYFIRKVLGIFAMDIFFKLIYKYKRK